jgi:hypothetical protein
MTTFITVYTYDDHIQIKHRYEVCDPFYVQPCLNLWNDIKRTNSLIAMPSTTCIILRTLDLPIQTIFGWTLVNSTETSYTFIYTEGAKLLPKTSSHPYQHYKIHM